jgi:hypothetical protein
VAHDAHFAIIYLYPLSERPEMAANMEMAANIDNLTTMRDKKLTAFEENGGGASADCRAEKFQSRIRRLQHGRASGTGYSCQLGD